MLFIQRLDQTWGTVILGQYFKYIWESCFVIVFFSVSPDGQQGADSNFFSVYICIHCLNFSNEWQQSQLLQNLNHEPDSKCPSTRSVVFLLYLSQHFPLIVMRYFSSFISDLVSKPQLHTNFWLFQNSAHSQEKQSVKL